MHSEAAKKETASIQALWDAVSDRMYGLSDKEKELGLGEKVNCLVNLSCKLVT